jgi:hypothetical protein
VRVIQQSLIIHLPASKVHAQLLWISPNHQLRSCEEACLAHAGCRPGSLQVLHKWNVWLRNVGEEKKVIVGEMVEDKAVELASTMVTETLIYSVCNSHQVLFPSRFMNVL